MTASTKTTATKDITGVAESIEENQKAAASELLRLNSAPPAAIVVESTAPKTSHTQAAKAVRATKNTIGGYAPERDKVAGRACVRVGNPECLRGNLVSVAMARGASPSGIKAAREAAATLALHSNLVIGGAREEDMHVIESFILYGGNVVVIIPMSMGNFNFREVEGHIAAGKLAVVSFFNAGTVWSDEVAKDRNAMIAKVAHSLFIAECVTRVKGGTLDFTYSGAYGLAEEFSELGKMVAVSNWTQGSRLEHLVLMHELGAIELKPVPMSNQEDVEDPFLVLLPQE